MPRQAAPSFAPREDQMNAMTQGIATAAPLPPSHDAVDLTGGGQTALIRLNDQCYTLRITRQGKLILTK